jgi:hypothetical protein
MCRPKTDLGVSADIYSAFILNLSGYYWQAYDINVSISKALQDVSLDLPHALQLEKRLY